MKVDVEVDGGSALSPWGPERAAGRRHRILVRVLGVLGVVVLVGATALATTLQLLVQQAEANLTRVPVPELDIPAPATGPRHFLVVGSDSREGLDQEMRSELVLGDFDGQRSDVIIYVAISQDRSAVSLVSLPRDLLVLDGERQRKLTDVFVGGPDEMIRVIRENFGLPVNHFAEVSVAGFIEVVRTLGGVEICLEEPLRDRRSGADFAAGCQQMGPAESLAYVRSRVGSRADFARIDRQQTFIRAVLGELTQRRVLTNPRQLYQLVEDVASNLTTDDQLGVTKMLGLADELRGVVSDGLPMTTVPAFPRTIGGLDYMIAYEPGARALFEQLRAGKPIEPRGTPDERGATVVAIHGHGRTVGAGIVRSTLAFAGFEAGVAGRGPTGTDPGQRTTVFAVPGEEQRAEWVAATLGAPQRPLPAGVELPAGATVLVAVGDDAR